MNIDQLLKGHSTVAVVCTQWGDTGKGKFVDLIAEWADVIARGTGGANAGHTVEVGGKKLVTHLIPCGIQHPGKVNVIGWGVVFDPRQFFIELDEVKAEGIDCSNLWIDLNAHLVLPQHILLDRLDETASGGKLGTTGRGIGPAYVDYVARTELTVNDMLNPAVFRSKLARNLNKHQAKLKGFDPELIRSILQHEHLGNGMFCQDDGGFDLEAIVDVYRVYGEALQDRVRDTAQLVRDAVATKKKVLLEGAQGLLLSVDYGTYPFVTSSDCSPRGLAHGVGLREDQVDLVLGIVKAPYMTRVGQGPFPTELGGAESDTWCGRSAITKEVEQERFPSASINSLDPMEQGVAIRQAGNEYGATTGRPRRVGWLDLPLLRYAKQFTGENIVLTKPDVLDACERIPVCHSYAYEGPDYQMGEDTLTKGDIVYTAYPQPEILGFCVPRYDYLEGWLCSISDLTTYPELPEQFRDLVNYIEKEAGVNVTLVSVGADREQTITVNPPR